MNKKLPPNKSTNHTATVSLVDQINKHLADMKATKVALSTPGFKALTAATRKATGSTVTPGGDGNKTIEQELTEIKNMLGHISEGLATLMEHTASQATSSASARSETPKKRSQR
ncbi:MAG: hypothetical protein H7301_05080 [Cryobacterium sp.]|nr:hypothetical protein [Oligoflexia bacterium]